MFKLIGIIVGVGLMLLAGLAWLDAPQAKKVSSQLHSELDQAIDQIAEPVPVTPLVVPEELPIAVQELLEQAVEQVVDAPIQEEAEPPITATSSWHIFWKPFRNIESAQGFASRLSQQTGVEISVISNEQGEHRMTFPFIDEEDKQRIIQLIKEKTGLEVGE